MNVAVAGEEPVDLLEADVTAADHQAAAALELQARHIQGRLQHVPHAGLIADPALELTDAFLALEGRCRHGSEVRGGQASAASVSSRPVSIVRLARQPSRSAVAVVSRKVRSTSPSRAGANWGAKSSRPKALPTRSTSSSTDVSTPVPTFSGPRSSLASAERSAETTSATWT